RTETEVSHYKVEPYVMTADVYTVPPHVGRGGWSWYTGASGWMYQVGLEGILGFRLQGDSLVINPCIPGDWLQYSMQYRHGATLYNIKVENPQHRMTGVAELHLDEAVIAGNAIPLRDDGITHNVRVVM
ncbi:MAG TPA: hypothetical protein VNU93_06640, partial [Verrucomicrobiae bacterium]|nr:hypothetical protein [Verrucomicrobiae bacterium]